MSVDIVERLRLNCTDWVFGNTAATAMKEILNLRTKVATLEAELERERMRLAACGTAALGYFEGCCDEYKSASLDDVLRLRAENTALREAGSKVEKLSDKLLDVLTQDVRCDKVIAMILTEEEITEVIDQGNSVEGNRYLPFAYARAIEAKVMAKLSKLEPVAYGVFDDELGWMYIADYKEAANEHINDAIWMELQNASFWRIVPLYRKQEVVE